MKVNFKFDHGQKVRDTISGVEGIIDAVSQWLNGCNRYSVQPKRTKKENKMPDSWWIDEQQLELIEDKSVTVKKTHTGGPSTCSSSARF